jgi:hypothetical protein
MFAKVANCVNYTIKLKQSNFGRNAKTILGFEHFSSKIRSIEKNCLLNRSWNLEHSSNLHFVNLEFEMSPVTIRDC